MNRSGFYIQSDITVDQSERNLINALYINFNVRAVKRYAVQSANMIFCVNHNFICTHDLLRPFILLFSLLNLTMVILYTEISEMSTLFTDISVFCVIF